MAVAFVTEGGIASGSNASSATFSLTTSGSNLVLYVLVTYYGTASDPTSVTFNGVGLTQVSVGQDWYDSTSRASLWRLIAPAVTTANVVATFPATVSEHSVAAVVYSGVDQTTPNRTIAAAVKDAASGSHTVSAACTSVSGDIVLGFDSYAEQTFTSTYGTTRSTHKATGFDGSIIGEGTASGTSTTVSYVISTFPGQALWALALIAATGGATKAISGTVNATSDLSGGVVRIRALSGTVNATSALSGAVVRIRQIAGTINATSALSGAVVRIRQIVGTINATSALSGALSFFGQTRNITGTANATSVLSGTLVALRAIAGSFSMTSNLSGAVVAQHVIAGTINATSNLAGVVSLSGQVVSQFISNHFPIIQMFQKKR